MVHVIEFWTYDFKVKRSLTGAYIKMPFDKKNSPTELRSGTRELFDTIYLPRHREDGPASIFSNGDYLYSLHGKRHRIGGPALALINRNLNQGKPLYKYYLWDVIFLEKAYNEAMKYLDENGMEAFILRYKE